MKILLCNDDGVYAPGINILAEHLKEVGDVVIIAPHRERSTAGHSLTLHKPLRINEIAEKKYAISGTPADCIWLGIRQVLKNELPDIVFSGINSGPNLGYDTYYSGTVAAAREACLLGVPAIAMSLAVAGEVKDAHFETPAKFAIKLVRQMVDHSKKVGVPLNDIFPPGVFLNVNSPDLPESEIKGVKVARMGHRVYSDQISEKVDPRGKKYYWLGGGYEGYKDIAGSDCKIIDESMIAVTPLKVDATEPAFYETLLSWNL
ncbi:5'/3'-nucleotidase SurE [Bdellovibrionota bacterium]